jgi:hypothetical protein
MKYFLIILFTALLFGRPTVSEHAIAISEEAANILNIEPNVLLYSSASNALLNKNLVVHNFYLFSVAEIQGQVISVGALRLVHVRTQILTLKLLL